MYSNICPQTLSVPKSAEQFSHSVARGIVSFEEQIMSKEKYPSTFWFKVVIGSLVLMFRNGYFWSSFSRRCDHIAFSKVVRHGYLNQTRVYRPKRHTA